ncbi:uncharacterized protein [Scyliorhinus torazame]|uniref:uncharacterized protein n=1 Tax=Scyliorhinus torazame TaxID=75743 RepID=UPI003B5CF847
MNCCCRCSDAIKCIWNRMENYHFFVCLMAPLLSAAAPPCSSHCTCVADLANCKLVPSLQEVLTDLPKSVVMILLQGGSITRIEPRAFRNFSNLEYLSITDFTMSLLSHAFTTSANEANRLQLLDLSNNRLESCNVESLAFADMQNLTELKLNKNSLNMLKPPWFSDLTSLNKLHIEFNKLSYLPPRIFVALARLNQLNIASNVIQYISTDTFYGLYSLSELDLSNNELIFVDKDAFGPLQQLRHLFLNNNHLVMLAKVPGSVQNLRLNSNPWECSCHLVLLLESQSEAIEDPGSLLCQSPENVKGKLILNLGPSYCSTTALLPATTPLLATGPASQLIPTLGARAVVYGFIGGLLLAVAICLIPCCRKYWVKGMLQSHTLLSDETKRKAGTKGQSDSPMGFNASKLAAVSVVAPRLTVEERRNVKEYREGKNEEHLKVSRESRRIRENAVEGGVLRRCKTIPDSLHAAADPHLQNKVSYEVEQRFQSRSCLTNLYKSQHHSCSQEEGPSNQVNVPKTHLAGTNNTAGNLLKVSSDANQSLKNGSSEACDPQFDDQDSPNANGSPILYGETLSSQLKKFRAAESQDLKTESLEGDKPEAFYQEQNEEVCRLVKVTRLKESASAVDACTGGRNAKIHWDPINPIGPKAGTHGRETDRYSNAAEISMGRELQNSTLSSGDGDTQLPDVEGRTCSTSILSSNSKSFGKQKLKLINKKSIDPPNVKTFLCGIGHGTKKRVPNSLTCSRTRALVNVRPGPNTISTSIGEWSNMNKEIISEASRHLLSHGVQTRMGFKQSKPKCKAQNLIRGGIPYQANQVKEEETTSKSPESQNDHKENNTLELLEVNGGFDDKYSEWQQTSSGNIQLSSSIGLKISNCQHVSRVAFSDTSHQEASHVTLCGQCCEQPRFNLKTCQSTLQQGSEHHDETYQFTSGHKLVASVEINVFDTIDGKENTLLDMPGANISPPDIVEFAHDECKKPEHIFTAAQNSVTDVSEYLLNETPACKNSAFMDETQQFNVNTFVWSHADTKETNLLGESSAVPTDVGIADSVIIEDEISQAGTASASFSWPFACSVQSQKHWSQSTTTLESGPGSGYIEANLSPNVTSKDDQPSQWGTRMEHSENNLDVEECANRSETTSFQNVSYRGSASINRESNLEQDQSPVIACAERSSSQKHVAIRREPRLNIGHCDHRSNHSKNIYKSVFKIIEEMQHQVPLDKDEHGMLLNSTALGLQADGAKPHMENVLIPPSPDQSVNGLQQIEAAGSTLEMEYPSSAHSRRFCNRFAERILAAASEGDDFNTGSNVQPEKAIGGSAHSQTETEGPADTRAQEDAHIPAEMGQWNPLTREELLTDDELMLINMLHTLKKTLECE